jgi:hypothetical protein
MTSLVNGRGRWSCTEHFGLAVRIAKARKSMVVVIRISHRTSHHHSAPQCSNGSGKMAAIEWEFSVRVSNVLRDVGIDTHEKLMNLTDRELLCLPNFGKRSLDEIWEYRRKQLDKIRDGALVKRFLSRINSLTRQVENLRRENRRLLTDSEKTREQSRQVISRLRRELADARGEAAVTLNGEDVAQQTIATSAWWNTADSN